MAILCGQVVMSYMNIHLFVIQLLAVIAVTSQPRLDTRSNRSILYQLHTRTWGHWVNFQIDQALPLFISLMISLLRCLLYKVVSYFPGQSLLALAMES